MKISFWGGPRDGDVLLKVVNPSEEIFCMDGYSELIQQQEFYETLRYHPLRSQPYARYVLDANDDGKVIYQYNGFV